MRVVMAAVLVMLGCAKEETYSASDFDSFHYFWYGTGAAGAFAMDRDCGVTAHGTLYYDDERHTGKATVPPVACDEFKSFAVSPHAIDAYENPTCSNDTDDYVTLGVTLTDGMKYGHSYGTSCSDDRNITALRARVQALRNSVIPRDKPDTGVVD
jgi:hypothetical protein